LYCSNLSQFAIIYIPPVKVLNPLYGLSKTVICRLFLQLFSPLKKIIPKALSDGYLQEVKQITSKQISIRQVEVGFKRKG